MTRAIRLRVASQTTSVGGFLEGNVRMCARKHVRDISNTLILGSTARRCVSRGKSCETVAHVLDPPHQSSKKETEKKKNAHRDRRLSRRSCTRYEENTHGSAEGRGVRWRHQRTWAAISKGLSSKKGVGGTVRCGVTHAHVLREKRTKSSVATRSR